ncbi:ABC transporter permease [Larkinella soli]|uniref:ABC transporter permease n=1 Tax=Larkinella soli TaxID=1770527 RepID=UPI000FFB41C4|nr:ABC transporter permease [Larkinella soli]
MSDERRTDPPDRRRSARKPPRWADRLLNRFSPPGLEDELQGDLLEMYAYWVKTVGVRTARRRYALAVLRLIRPFSRPRTKPTHDDPQPVSFHMAMLRNYVKIAWRNLIRQKTYSIINITGLASGMAVALLIGLWIWDELSFNGFHQHSGRIAQVMENQTLEQGVQTFAALPMPVSRELRTRYPDDFKSVAAAVWTDQIVAFQDRKFTRSGGFVESDFPEMMTFDMIQGSRLGLKDPTSVLISETTAKALFGTGDPLHKALKIGNRYLVQVAGVYRDLPHNSTFKNAAFLAPIGLLFEAGQGLDDWRSSSFEIYTLLSPRSQAADVSRKIRNVLHQHIQDKTRSSLFLYPMPEWHLYNEFKNGTNSGGRIQFVWLFGMIGAFVLLLACINFMNLSTARSEKRAKEVGIRKALGSVRSQLAGQFLSESFLVVTAAFGFCTGLVWLMLPLFNEIADKRLVMPWSNPVFWLLCLGFMAVTGFVAGSYPAFYLSSFQAIRVLKGTFRSGRLATVPRKVLVVVQFSVSVTLIIGTIVVFRQIQFARNRPVGYSRDGLINITMNTPEIQGRYEELRQELLASGVVADMAESSSPITSIWSSANNLEWRGKDPNRPASFGTISVTPDFGKVVGWKIKEGRDFSRQYAGDSLAFLLNEAAVKLTGLKKPVGETIRWHDKSWKLIGVVKDMVMRSPFEPVVPTVFMINTKERGLNVIHIRLHPKAGVHTALRSLEAIFKKRNPASPFEYTFADQEYALKFAAEERIGTLASGFAMLAIFISCLGLFGLSSFVAEQRTREIGIRKVFGASVLNVWRLLSKDFVVLVLIAFFLAVPIAYYFLGNWLRQYEYRTDLSWWVFAVTGVGALLLTLLTVSIQAVRAALINPVNSLRSE